MTRIIDGKVYFRLAYWLNLVEYVDVNFSREEISSFWVTKVSPIRHKILSLDPKDPNLSKYYRISNCLYVLLDDKYGICGKVTLYCIRGSFLHRVADLSHSHDPAKVAEEVIMVGLTDMAVAGGDFS